VSAPASPDTRSRLLERAAAAGLEVPDDQVERLVVFYELLFRWNRTINLTALQDSLEALDRLLLEPLSAARHLEARGSLMDVGSGGGSPGIPLSIALAPTRVLLVESRGRKAAFLREALRTLNIPGDVYQGRFEELPQTPTEPAALISVRAVRMSHSELNVLRQLLGRAEFWRSFEPVNPSPHRSPGHSSEWVDISCYSVRPRT
jgi:16S rRNA (guanine527-N7)-methyltransferase